ncbi:MAG: maleate cis-trans isomerase [Pseudomonadota bacterium]
MFEPDGWVYRARIGLLVPDGDVGPESEISAMVPPGVGVNASRFRFPSRQDAPAPGQIGISPVEAVAAPGPLDDAVRLVARAPVDAIALAFTSTSYVGGDGDDPRLAERLAALSEGKPVVTTGEAILQGLKRLGAARVMLVDPPWFPPALTDQGAAWLTRNGLAVAQAAAADLPGGQGAIHPGGLYRWIKAAAPPDVDAIVIGGNGFRAVGAVRALEADLKIPVVAANAALLWRVLRTLGLPTGEVTRYGRLFAED